MKQHRILCAIVAWGLLSSLQAFSEPTKPAVAPADGAAAQAVSASDEALWVGEGITVTTQKKADLKTINPFTGKILKNRVRLRLQPSLESTIIKELNDGEFVIVAGETDEFYAIEPPSDLKAYVYRTYVLDGVIEGNHVNIRLSPELTAPVIEQMNTGDKVVNGVIYAKDKHWIEFSPPASVKFYVAKDYVKRIGDKNYIITMKKRQQEVQALLASATTTIQSEMQKPFDQIHIDDALRKLNLLIQNYTDFTEENSQAKALLASTQEGYMRKKLAAMEQKLYAAQSSQQKPQPSIPATTVKNSSQPTADAAINSKMASWQHMEQEIYEVWAKEHKEERTTLHQFYSQQETDAVDLTGMLEPYSRAIKNKPGDYILMDQTTHLPIAYLYSTHVNLEDKVGQRVQIKAAPRDNHNFAFPAYYVLSMQGVIN